MPNLSKPFNSTPVSYTWDGVNRPLGSHEYGVRESRSTTNRNVRVTAAKRSLWQDGPAVIVPVKVPTGPRLAYKVWNAKLGKYIWAREYITVFKVIRKRTKSKPVSSKNPYVLPNDLFYSKCTRDKPSPATATWTDVTYPNSQHPITCSGDLADTAWKPEWGGGGCLDPYSVSFGFGSVSPKVQNALNEMDSRVVSRLYAKCKDQSVSLAQILAERDQSARTIASLATRIGMALINLKRGNALKASSYLFPKSAKELANDVLMVQYGLRPMISDLNGLVDHFQKPRPDQGYNIRTSDSQHLDEWEVYSATTDSGIFKITDSLVCEADIKVKYNARITLSSSTITNLKQLGFLNLPALGWELIPYSFVVDWLLPVGKFLNNQDAFQGLSVNWVTRTTVVEQKLTWRRKVTQGSNPKIVASGFDSKVKETLFECERKMLQSMPALPAPEFKNPFSGEHCLNAVSLLTQLYRK